MTGKTAVNQNRPMDRPTLRVISNMRRLGDVCTKRFLVQHRFVDGGQTVWDGVRLFFQSLRSDLVILNSDTRRILVFCLLKWLVPFHRCRLVSVNHHLSQPTGVRGRLRTRVKRLLLRKVDRFILYFTDLEGYDRFYGISAARTTFVPSKVNQWQMIGPVEELSADGEYIFCGGRTYRDLPTFIAAMRQLEYPGLLLYQNAALMKSCGTELDLSNLPNNLRAEEHDGDERGWFEYIRRARVVVVPMVSSSIYAAGLSVYLLAMGLRKCVIITDGPQTRGLITDEAIIVPPADPVALADAINRAWEDADLRERTANAGRRYAERLGGESRLLSDILNVCGDLVMSRHS